jgi:site-specific recombinase XerD
MSKHSSRGAGAAFADGLDDHLAKFLTTLARSGYVNTTRHDKRRAIVPFIRWVRRVRIAVAKLDEASLKAFLARPSRRRSKHGDPERVAVHQFVDYLRAVGVVPPRAPSKPSPAGILVGKYLGHLRNTCGLCARSVEVYSPLVCGFVAAQRLPVRRRSLDASAVRDYLLERSQNRSVSFVKLLASALRSFLRFLFLDGGTVSDLSIAVPPIRRWRLAAVPPFLTSDEVEQVIAATDRTTASGRRALAILLLLARLGLRACEVVALELDDLRWDQGEIVVRGKGRAHHRLPLPHDVGQALARYLQKGRGRSTSRRVFLRRCAPHVALSGPTTVCIVAREAVRRVGLRPAGRVGAHIFRHSLATRMLRHGASFAEIAQVLRHRSTDTTKLYAKVDLEALRGVALPWPTMEVRS